MCCNQTFQEPRVVLLNGFLNRYEIFGVSIHFNWSQVRTGPVSQECVYDVLASFVVHSKWHK